MRKTAIFVIAAMFVFAVAGCSAQLDQKANNARNGDLDIGQNLYDKRASTDASSISQAVPTATGNGFRNNNYSGFAVYTPFGPLNPSEAPPLLNMPIEWYRDYNIVTDFNTL